jgi:hypothetical protein
MRLFIRRRHSGPDLVSPQQSDYGIAVLLELNRSGRHIYEGTVSPAEKAKRRARNKAARAARRVQR